jgi:hypothetical protein
MLPGMEVIGFGRGEAMRFGRGGGEVSEEGQYTFIFTTYKWFL